MQCEVVAANTVAAVAIPASTRNWEYSGFGWFRGKGKRGLGDGRAIAFGVEPCRRGNILRSCSRAMTKIRAVNVTRINSILKVDRWFVSREEDGLHQRTVRDPQGGVKGEITARCQYLRQL